MIRERQELSQNELAAMSGIPQSTISAGADTHEIILEFTWPDLETPETTGLKFWSAFLKPDSSDIIGEVDMIEWEYMRGRCL